MHAAARPAAVALVAALLGLGAATWAAGAPRPTLAARPSQYGTVLFDGRGRVLYAFTRDRRGGRSTCFGACARAWPPYLVSGPLRAGKGVRRALLGTVRRGGRRQVTYAGRPLYRYVGDAAGEVGCQNVREFGGLWLVQRPGGALVR